MKDGFSDLRTPEDLVRKLEHDRERMNVDPKGTYAAFDFFVTAEHVLDWVIPDERGKPRRDKERKDRREAEPLLKIASHIASGAKHFRATAAQHTSVQDVEAERGGFHELMFPGGLLMSPMSFTYPGLSIKLDDDRVIQAHELADKKIAYWKKELGM